LRIEKKITYNLNKQLVGGDSINNLTDLQKDFGVVKQAIQKVQYSKELLTEAVSQICQIQKPTSQITTEPLVVAVHTHSPIQDDIFVLAFSVSKMISQEWEFIFQTLNRIESQLNEKCIQSNLETHDSKQHDSRKSLSIVSTHQETPRE